MEKPAAEAALSRGSNWRGGGTSCRRSSVQPAKRDSTCSATVTFASSIISSTIWLASLTCTCLLSSLQSERFPWCQAHHLLHHLDGLSHLHMPLSGFSQMGFLGAMRIRSGVQVNASLALFRAALACKPGCRHVCFESHQDMPEGRSGHWLTFSGCGKVCIPDTCQRQGGHVSLCRFRI